MGVPTTEVGLTPTMPRRENHEVHKWHVVAVGKIFIYIYIYIFYIIYCLLLAILAQWKKKPFEYSPCCSHNHHNHHYHHHKILSVLVNHSTSMKSSHSMRSPSVPLTSFHDLLVLLISPSIALRHVLFSLPLLVYRWGFQSNAVFSVAPVSLRNVCPIQFHILPSTWFSI